MTIMSNLAADLYKAADIVGRELTGFIPSCTINAGGERAALGESVKSFATPKAQATDIVPSMTVPEGNEQTIAAKQLDITKGRGVEIPWTGEQMLSARNSVGYETVYGDQIAQAFRTLTNEVEADLALAAKRGASRAVGAAGQNPFGSNFDVIAEARQVAADNGMPVDDGRWSLVMNTTAGTGMRKLSSLYKVNESGSDQMLRRGVLLDLQGALLRESGQIRTHTKGTGAGFLLNGALSADAEEVTVDTGTGTILAGDVVSFAGDTNLYVANSNLAANKFSIGSPGLVENVADNSALTVGASYTPNIYMHQGAMELAMRAPAQPEGGDVAAEEMVVQDPFSGLTFRIALYKGFQKTMLHVSAVWGFKVWNPDAVVAVRG